jgi:hypothetical protein
MFSDATFCDINVVLCYVLSHRIKESQRYLIFFKIENDFTVKIENNFTVNTQYILNYCAAFWC